MTISDTPAHGVVAIIEREARVAFPTTSPLSAYNAATGMAVGVTYTSAPDCTGDNTLTIDGVTPDG